ncbi:MAG TPA: ATP-binding protein [Rhizomicrobium sp.]
MTLRAPTNDARKKAKAAGLQLETLFADTIFASVPGILYLYDERGRFLRWNRYFEIVSGYGSDEVARMVPLDFFAGADKDLVARRIRDVFERGEASVEAGFVTRDGRTLPFFFTGRRILFDGATCLAGMGIDITEQKQTEAALRASAEHYRSTLDNLMEGCQLIAFDWSYLYLNRAAARHNRRPNEELLGRRMMDAWPGIEDSEAFAVLRRCMEERIALHKEVLHVFPDGGRGWFDMRCQPVPEGIFALSIDISDRRLAETRTQVLLDELAHVTRLTEMGQLSAALAHELNQPLTAIASYVNAAHRTLKPVSDPRAVKAAGILQKADEQVARTRQIIRRLRDFVEKREPDRAPQDINAIAGDAIALGLVGVNQANVTLRTRLDRAVPAVFADKILIQQVVINLMRNAMEAMAGSPLRELTVATSAEREMVEVSVADTGTGVPDAVARRLFEPFFTTKSQGMGIGLMICRSIIEAHEGKLWVTPNEGGGSVFRFCLPVATRLEDEDA